MENDDPKRKSDKFPRPSIQTGKYDPFEQTKANDKSTKPTIEKYLAASDIIERMDGLRAEINTADISEQVRRTAMEILSCMEDADGISVSDLIQSAGEIADNIKEGYSDELRRQAKIGLAAEKAAHDLSNIQTVLLNYNDPEMIRQFTQRATMLINDIVRFAEEKPLNKKEKNVTEIVRESMVFLNYNDEINVNTDFDDDCIADIDENRIALAIQNLLINASQAIEEKGEISISVNNVRIKNKGRYVCIKIKDNGCGIPGNLRKNIFDAHFTTKGQKGTGLGLAIVKENISLHNGKISLKSKPGEGTTFTVYLPASERNESKEKYEKGHLIIIDDESALSKLNTRFAERIGMSSEIFDDTNFNLEAINNAPSNSVLLIDQNLSGNLIGSDIAETIKKTRPDIKIILCTGCTDRFEFNAILKKGVCDGFLMKPYTYEDFKKALDKS
jgi:signal transduction histidine kinase